MSFIIFLINVQLMSQCSTNTTSGGTISGNQSSCGNFNPSIMSSTTVASGGSGTISYQWEYSHDNATWVTITGATAATYDPTLIYQTTFYRRKSKTSTCAVWGANSNVITKSDFGFDNFQILTEGNQTYTNGSRIHGPVAMGGDLTLASSAKVEFALDNVGTYIFVGDGTSYTGLLVRGKVNWTNGYAGVSNSKLMHIGNSTGSLSGDNGTNAVTQVYPTATSYNNVKRIEGTLDQTPSPAVFQTVGYDFTYLFNGYRTASTNLGANTNNVQLYNSSNVAISGNNVTSSQVVKVTSLSAGFNYLNLTTASLNNISEINFSGTGIPSSSNYLVINVPITADFNWNNSLMSGLTAGSNAPYILWNFYGNNNQTVTIAQNSQIFGTVFAPNMNITKTGTGNIEGSIVAKTTTLGLGDINYFMYALYCNILTCVNRPSATFSGNTNICSSASTTLTAAGIGGSGVYSTYAWSHTLGSGATKTVTPTSTTTYTVTITDGNGCTGTSNVTVTVHATPTPNAGIDQSQCHNSGFELIGSNPGTNTIQWSVNAGTALTTESTANDSITYSVAPGQSATLRYTLSNPGCSAFDDVVISNTTSCSTACTNPLNSNGDLEYEGNATTFPLTFQSTPAALIDVNYRVPGWADSYGASVPNTSSFTGAYYIKKTGTQGNPHSGNHMIYVNGSYCVSALATNVNLACGRTYKFSAWVAAYTNNTTQTSSNFAIEFSSSDDGDPANYLRKLNLVAPASTSWNSLNWQRYEMLITIPSNGYTWGDFFFTPLDNASGILIDDVCITEVSGGSLAIAGNDIFNCGNIITLNATPAGSGYTGTWSVIANGGLQLADVNSPNTNVTIASGNTGTLRWTVTNGTCTSFDEVNIGYANASPINVNDEAICTGSSVNLTAANCTGSILWNTGATTPTITVTPTSTTSYSVTCTPAQSTNLALNPGFESATNFQNWADWGLSGITTTSGEYRTGSKGVRINATTGWGGFAQSITATPGTYYTVSFWAKTTNTHALSYIGVKFLNSTWNEISTRYEIPITSIGWQKYTIQAVAPLTAASFEIYATASESTITYLDDVEVYGTTGCTSSDNATVTVITNNDITLGTPVVSAAINHPLQDVATVSLQVSWGSAPANDKLKITHNNKSEYIDVAGGATSPQIVTFMVPADGDNNKVVAVSWLNNPTYACTKYATFATPAPINNQKINCDVLYLCGLDKPNDGDPFDHGIINYIIANNNGTLTPALTKTDATGYGLYDPLNPSTLLSINLDNYEMVIVSATTEGHIATDLIKALAGWKGSVLNMNYDQMQELGYAPNNYTHWNTAASTSNTVTEEIYNYDNINPWMGYVMTVGDYYPQANANLWNSTSAATNGLGGISFKYSAHSNPNISSTHGTRVYLGYHMNGIYANAQNGGSLPAPVSSYFSPIKHLTLKGKEIFDNALVSASTCSVEICTNGIDDDGDGLVDCYDPDCGQVTNREFDNGTAGWALYQNSPATATFTIDATSQVSGANSALINTTSASGTDWHIQLAQVGKSIVSGKTYKFSFKAKAATARTISSAVDLGASPWTTYTWNSANLTTSVQTFTYTFTATVTVTNNIRTLFNLGVTAGNVWIDDVRLEEVCSVFSCPSGDCQSSNQVTNGSFTTNINDWTASNGQLSLGTGGTYGNFIVLNNSDLSGNYTVYQDVIFEANEPYKLTGYFAKHATSNNAKMYLEFYNGTTFISKTSDVYTTFNYDGTFQAIPPIEGITPANTTKIRIVGYANGTALKFDEINLIKCIAAPSILSVTDASRCGTGTVTLGASASVGTINWYAAATGGSSLGTGSSFTTPSISSTTTYYVDATNSGCTTSSRTAVVATINTTTATITGLATICVGANTTLSPTTGGTWTSSTPSVATVTNAGIVTGVSAGSATFTFTNSTTGCISNATSPITINSKPIIVTTTPASRCDVGTVTLGATASAGTINWYSASTGGSSLGTGSSFITPSLSSTTTYYVDATNASCTTTTRTAVTATIGSGPTITGTTPGSRCGTGTVTLGASASAGTINWYAASTGGSSLGTGSSFITPSISTTTTYYVDATNAGCTTTTRSAVTATVTTAPSIVATTPGSRCDAGPVTLGASASAGTINWYSVSTGGSSLGTGSSFTTPSISTTTTYYVDATNAGCTTATRTAVTATIGSGPTIITTTPGSRCGTGTVTLGASASAGTINWYAASTGGSSLGTGNSFTTPSISSTTTYYVDATNGGCTTASRTAVIATVGSNLSIDMNYMGSVCMSINKQISVNVNNGTAPFTYTWTGPSSFSGNTQTISITNNGNYYVTVSDAVGCSATTSGFIYQSYQPLIVSLQSDICEGQSVGLNVNSSSAVSYAWSANAGNATTANVTVFPSYPSSTYTVTVTNDVGCTAAPTATITVKQKPIVNVTGSSAICEGGSTTLSPTNGGTWSSNNPAVATVTNAGVVSGVAAGVATFTFTNSTTTCISDPTTPITVNAKPTVLINGPNAICIGSTTQLWPTTGGNWVSSNSAIASVTNAGVVTGLSQGNVTFIFTNTTTGCASNATGTITVDNQQGASISGPSTVCMGNTIQLTASVGSGTWTSSNTGVAIINSSGIVTPIAAGTTTITYNHNSGSCANATTKNITVNDKPTVAISGPNTICVGATSSLTPTSGGTWNSSNTSIATVTNAGVVTGVGAGTANFTFTNSTTGCTSDASANITINGRPIVSITGPSTICAGTTTTLSPTTGGTWSSSNNSIATVTNAGIVTGVSNGTVTFTFTNSTTGCISNATSAITVGASFTSTINYNGSVCLTNNKQLTGITSGGVAPFQYNWIGPLGFTGNTQTVTITNNGSYGLTITDALGCSHNVSGYVYEKFDPVIVNLNTTVCEGTNVNLSVTASNVQSYLWSSNAGNATTSSVNVLPTIPSSTYYVTVTNNYGCTAVGNAAINVNQKPVISIVGNDSICVGSTTSLLPSSGGSWLSNNASIATISNSGVVTGVAAGSTTFVFTNSTTNCSSNPSAPITVNGNTTVSTNGPSTICIGDTTYLLPSSGGTWTNSNPSVASVNAQGRVIGLISGVTNFTFTNSQTGCPSSNGSINITVSNKPVTSLSGDDEICINSTTTYIPSSGGTWTSNNPTVATITNSGVVTGVGLGNATFVFKENSTGCKSDNSTPVSIINGTTVSITGPTSICIGSTTTLSPTTGGTWTSNNPGIASVTNSGIVTGINAGSAYFTFNDLSTGCSSITSQPVNVLARPIVAITGPNSICIGSTTQMSPPSGGTWISNNPSVATITNAGVVTGVSTGNVTFTFTNSTTGCISNNSQAVSVYTKPTVSVTGPSDICIGGNTTLYPNTGGTWTSSNPSVASVTNSGIVTGLSIGSANFVYSETNSSCTSDPTTNVNVISKPIVSITGPSIICVGNTTTLSPTTGGAWISSNNAIATVNSSGVVTGVSQGSVTFTFIANGGCTSDPTAPIIINGKPTISISGPNSICIGANTQMNPSTSGTWQSLNPGIASISNSGLVTGLASGVARFKYTNSATGCISDASNEVTVNSPPIVTLTGPSQICIGNTTQVNPTVGGIWTSSNPSIASVNNSGLIMGINPGTASFTFTNTTTGCQSTSPISITVLSKPIVSIVGPTQICINGTTTLSPSTGGTWISNNPAVATVTNAGIVTGINSGSAKFMFTNSTTGCSSAYTNSVIVNANPSVYFTGPEEICIGSNTTIAPTSGGVWVSSNTSVATITNNGTITGIAEGKAVFRFTETTTGCTSLPSDSLNVMESIDVSITGPAVVCMDYNTTLSPATGGYWTSMNPNIAAVTSSGIVTGKAPGKVGFYFTQALTGCVSYLANDAITIENCINPDFNVTAISVAITGNVNTNDNVVTGTTYGTPMLESKPNNSNPSLVVNSNGSYTFSSSIAGVYLYNVPVCIPPLSYGCPSYSLRITVIDPSLTKNTVINTDITSVYKSTVNISTLTNLNTLTNDDCIMIGNCTISAATDLVVNNPKHGTKTVDVNGIVVYAPIVNYIGKDTISYSVCDPNCVTSKQFITIRDNTALNTVVASDDFAAGKPNEQINLNLITNDSDPEGNSISIVPVGSLASPIVNSKGSYYISNTGILHFTPAVGFSGGIDIIYQICDNNTNQACTKATAHLLIIGDMSIKLRMYLEGPLVENGNALSSTGKPLMRDNLRANPYDSGKNCIPARDPYKFGTQFVNFSESPRFTHVASGLNNEFNQLLDSVAIFSVTGENAIVDWVFIELRSKNNPTQVLATRAALLQRDGDVVDIDGSASIRFPGISLDTFYVVAKHRSHLGVMSQKVTRDILMDFTNPTFSVFNYGTEFNNLFDFTGLSQNNGVKYGYSALWAGDANADGKIKFTNPDDDQNNQFFDVFSFPSNETGNANFDFSIGYLQGDYNMDGKAKYDNPNDDKNLLFSQVILYPLNTGYLANFSFIIEQVP